MSDCPVVGGSDINPTNMVSSGLCLLTFFQIVCLKLNFCRCLHQINSRRLDNHFLFQRRDRRRQSLKLERKKSSGCIPLSKCSGTQCCARAGGGRTKTSRRRTWATSSAFTMQIMNRRGRRCWSGKPSMLTSAETLGSKALVEKLQTTHLEQELGSSWGKILR